jgi:hypothetical protein
MQYKSLLIFFSIGLNIGLSHASDPLPEDIRRHKITQELHKIDDDLGTNLTSYANTCKAHTEAVKGFREEHHIPKLTFLRIPSGSEVETIVLTNKWHRDFRFTVYGYDHPYESGIPKDGLKGLTYVCRDIGRFALSIDYENHEKLRFTFIVPYLPAPPCRLTNIKTIGSPDAPIITFKEEKLSRETSA